MARRVMAGTARRFDVLREVDERIAAAILKERALLADTCVRAATKLTGNYVPCTELHALADELRGKP
jgi:hypothetical protein